jgi:hypothetical protein
MATIDVVLHTQNGKYFAFVKDERYPTLDWVTGKTVRIAQADNLLGPYNQPGPPISPNFREAPTLIPSPNGRAWYLYYEQYPGVAYGVSVTDRLDGQWFQLAGNMNMRDWDKYRMSPGARHGTMLVITEAEYDYLVAAFPSSSQEVQQQQDRE